MIRTLLALVALSLPAAAADPVPLHGRWEAAFTGERDHKADHRSWPS